MKFYFFLRPLFADRFLLIYSYSKERNALIKKNRIFSNLDEIIDVSLLLLLVQPYVENQHIQVTKNTNCHVYLLCDKVHLQEVFINLFKNAIEALSSGGQLYVITYETKKHIVVEAKDNGIGIATNDLPRVSLYNAYGKGD